MKKYFLPTLTIATLTIGVLLGTAINHTKAAQRFFIQNGQVYSQPESKLDALLQLLQVGYVDSLTMDSITEVAMHAIVEQLDPHSSYIPKEDLEMVNSELSSSFSGVGVQFNIRQDTVRIVAVIPGGPSEGVGVLAGDRLIMVDGQDFTGKTINNEKVMHTLRGEKGTDVTITVLRYGVNEPLTYTITRGDIPMHSVDAKFLITPENIGFVRVNRFGETTYREFITAMAELRAKGATSYIIDLRENSGGYMDQAIQMANEFLDYGDGIVYAEGRAYKRFDAVANGRGHFRNVPLVVLIDDFSASASEIFAGAMQDNDRATIVGRRSFGKGLVQQQFPFEDGSALRMTVARYYTPSGRSIQKPYVMGEQENYQQELLERFDKGEFFSADSVALDSTQLYQTKSGRTVYGGGGIMPDIFVGRDTSLYTPYFNRIVNMAYTYQFAAEYTDRHRQELMRYTTWQALEQHLIQAKWMPELVQFCAGKGIEKNEEQLRKSRPLLVRLVNAYIVRNILGDEGFFPLFERDDEITKRAVQVLRH